MSKIDTGYEGTNVPEDFFIPPCGIEDVDRALFNLFNETIRLEVEVNQQTTKVPVVFAAGERFALTRRKQPIRDRNGALILPVIAIARKSVDISPGQSGYGTPISVRDQSSYYVKRRLSSEDRRYQKLINKLRLKNQDSAASRGNFSSNLISPGDKALPGAIASRRNGENLSYHSNENPDLLEPDLGDNIFEVISVPYPDFFVGKYEITFWTQYTMHMNQLIEVMISNFSGQGMEFQIESPSGYQFVAYVDGALTSGDNFEDYSSDERLIRYSFNLDIPGYLIAPNQPGLPSPFRSFVSAPQIEFNLLQNSGNLVRQTTHPPDENNIDNFILSDVEEVDSRGKEPLRRGEDGVGIVEAVEDPFSTDKKKRFLKVLTRDQRSGESTISARSVIDLETLT